MSLAFGSGSESDLIGARPVPRSSAATKGGGVVASFCTRLVSSSRDRSERAIASIEDGKPIVANHFGGRAKMSGDEKEIRSEFGRIADVAGLTEDEQTALFGGSRELSRVILALETANAAFDLLGGPAAAVAWLRGENPEEPFNGRSPLQLIVDEGCLGVEITLLCLRARFRMEAEGLRQIS